MRISKGGQLSIPASIRRRWGTSTVILDDQESRIVLEPAPDDPVAAAEGTLAEFGPMDLTELRSWARREEVGATDRRSPQNESA